MPQPDRFLIGRVTVYPLQHRVQREGLDTRIEPRLMTLLLCLAAKPGAVVTRTNLLDAAWPTGYGTDEGLTKAISELRRALGDSAREARIIETVPKQGYRLVAPVQYQNYTPPAPEHPPVPTLRPTTRRLAPLWSAIVVLAVALAGQWAYLTRDTPTPAQRQIRYHIPLDSTAATRLVETDMVEIDSLFLSTTEGTPVVVRRRVHLPDQLPR